MSWKDQIDNAVFSIKTGDNKTYFPLLRVGSKSKEFNSTIFEYINVDLSFVDKKKGRSGNYNLVFYFQGDDHLDIAENFEVSADDSRYWVVNHPIFGELIGQPISFERDESNLGVSVFLVDFWETINDGSLSNFESAIDKIKELMGEIYESSSESYGSEVKLEAVDQNKTKNFLNKINSRIENVLSDEFYNDYQSVLSEALNYADDMILKPVDSIKRINRLIDIPNRLNQSVEFRGLLMTSIWNDVKNIFGKFSTKNDKSFIQSVGAAVISSLSLATVTPLKNDYITSKNTYKSASILNDLFTDYLEFLDALQANSNSSLDNYNLDFETQVKLKSLVSASIFNLFDIAFNAKQERTVELMKDSNLIILTHKYLGLDEKDENLEIFRNINNIKNNQVFKVKKGTKITYFV